MYKQIVRDMALLIESHDKFRKDERLQEAIRNYANKNGLTLPERIVFLPGIDFVGVYHNGYEVLHVNLPPVSDYPVSETEHTDKYLRRNKSIAV